MTQPPLGRRPPQNTSTNCKIPCGKQMNGIFQNHERHACGRASEATSTGGDHRHGTWWTIKQWKRLAHCTLYVRCGAFFDTLARVSGVDHHEMSRGHPARLCGDGSNVSRRTRRASRISRRSSGCAWQRLTEEQSGNPREEGTERLRSQPKRVPSQEEFYLSRRNVDEVSWNHLSADEQSQFSQAIDAVWQGVLDFEAVTLDLRCALEEGDRDTGHKKTRHTSCTRVQGDTGGRFRDRPTASPSYQWQAWCNGVRRRQQRHLV